MQAMAKHLVHELNVATVPPEDVGLDLEFDYRHFYMPHCGQVVISLLYVKEETDVPSKTTIKYKSLVTYSHAEDDGRAPVRWSKQSVEILVP